MSNVVDQYGWHSSTGNYSHGYGAPAVLRILKRLAVNRVCDLGSGNGALAGAMRDAGFQVAGVEYDKQGVEIARKNYIGINFYNFKKQLVSA
jgi:predicted RNA methylase